MKPLIVGLALAASTIATPAIANADGIYVSGQISFGSDSYKPHTHNRVVKRTIATAPPVVVHRPAVTTRIVRPTNVHHQAPVYVDTYDRQPAQGYRNAKAQRKRAKRACRKAIKQRFGGNVSNIYFEEVNRIYKPGSDKFRISASFSPTYNYGHGHGYGAAAQRNVMCVANTRGEILRLRPRKSQLYNTRAVGYYKH